MILKGCDRNKPCYCGSGKKYKKCCWIKDENVRSFKKYGVILTDKI